MDIRAEVWSPLQNTAVWLGAWLHGLEATDNLVDALHDLGAEGLVEVLGDIRRCALIDAASPAVRLILSGPGEAPALPAGGAAARAASISGQALVLAERHVLVPDKEGNWQWFEEEDPLPAPAWLSPGEADELLTRATAQAAQLVTDSGYRTDVLEAPRLTVGTLADFYDTPGLPAAVPPRAAKLFARADRVAAIIETVKTRMKDHRIDPQLLGLWRHIRAARMAGVDYAVRDFDRLI
ncbi:MAG: hypothetical protein Q4G50_06960 [Corynebacterium sp.]|uniref:hypothetical protein n=1 Tax=Corynebacterium sp. TaxID=1720 RepID=UPI0026E0E33D|nr:hypothetical protein [Corynebacterium sp.]MDO5669726.1 hypothetical protein [Corynebacterium sp.]